jgi:hypothetical protein
MPDCTSTKTRFIVIFRLSFPIALCFAWNLASAQQYVTDDAAIVEYKSFQVELWHGKHSSWVLPAFHVVRNLEITTGFGLPLTDGQRRGELLLQGKILIVHGSDERPGVGLVTGTTLRLSRPQDVTMLGNVYAYAPVSFAFLEGTVVVHQNLGWIMTPEAIEVNAHNFTYATRVDWNVLERISLWIEAFGQNGSRPAYQFALRGEAVTDRLIFTLSYHGTLSRELSNPGAIAGLSWTPPPVF